MSNIPTQRNLKNVVLFQEDFNSYNHSGPSPLTLSIHEIVLSESQPRRYFDQVALENLMVSIQKEGILQPLLVRPIDKQYELVAGERRYRAAKKLGLIEVPVIIKSLSDEEAKGISLMENLQREDLNPIEETEGILALLSFKLGMSFQEAISLLVRLDHEARGNIKRDGNEKKFAHNVMGREEIEDFFKPLGITWQSFLKNRLPLLKLPQDILNKLREGAIAYTKAKAIAKIKEDEVRKQLLEESIANNLSLSQIREKIKEIHLQRDAVVSPSQRLSSTYQKLNKAKVWQDAKKWRKVETLLAKLDALLED